MIKLASYRTFLYAMLSTTLVTAAIAQDTNGANAAMTLQGLTASVADPLNHEVIVPAPGVLQIAVSSGANPLRGIILVSGPYNPGVFNTPWGGSIDLGTMNPNPPFLPNNVQIVGDGVFFSTGSPFNSFFTTDTSSPPEFRLQLGVPSNFAGITGPAYQAVVSDPTNPPFFFDNTEAANPRYSNSQIITVPTSDDGSVLVQLLPGKTFNYYGMSFTELYVNGNGVISFTSPLVFPGVFYQGNTIGQVNDVPHISCNWSDWNITQQSPSDGVLYFENGTTIDIGWGASLGSAGTSQPGISHFGDSDASEFHCLLEVDNGLPNPNEGRIQFVYTSLDPAAINNNDAVIGIVRGGGLGSLNFNQDFHQGVVGGMDDTLLEEHDSAAALLSGVRIGYDGAGSRQCYHNGNKFNGQTATFTPNPSAMTTGDQGYTVSMSAPRPNDATAITPVTGSNTGGDMVTICGWFRFFDTAANPNVASVVFDPSGANVPGIVLGVFDNSSTNDLGLPNPTNPEYRDHEGLIVITPVAPSVTGNVDVLVNFEDGSSFLLPQAYQFTNPGTLVTVYNALADDGIQVHNLTIQPTVSLGGIAYTQLRICSNGFVSFGTTAADFTQTTAEFMNGFRTPGTAPGVAVPGVAIAWQDMNPPFGVPGDLVSVTEDALNGSVTVSFVNQTAWNSSAFIGSVSATFGSPAADSVTFDFSQYLTVAGTGPLDDPIVGITAGSDDPSFGYAQNVVNLTGGMSPAIGGPALATGSFCQAFGGFDAAPLPTWEPVDLQGVNGSGMWTALDLGGYTYLLF